MQLKDELGPAETIDLSNVSQALQEDMVTAGMRVALKQWRVYRASEKEYRMSLEEALDFWEVMIKAHAFADWQDFREAGVAAEHAQILMVRLYQQNVGREFMRRWQLFTLKSSHESRYREVSSDVH